MTDYSLLMSTQKITDYSLLFRAIDSNNDNKISNAQEVKKAQALGLNAQQGQPVENILTQNQEYNLQEALKRIDDSQTVDNNDNKNNQNLFAMSASINKSQENTNGNENNDNIKRRKFSALA